MSNATHETAPTEFVQVGGVRFAYRRFSRPGDLPLLLLNHLAATLDDWDPLVTKGLASEREVKLIMSVNGCAALMICTKPFRDTQRTGHSRVRRVAFAVL